MCFSAPASFVSATVLTAIDIFCLQHLRKKDKKYVLFALIPLFFGIQQFIEGCVWLVVKGGHESMLRILAYLYLFFAFSFWPVFIPLAVLIAKPREKRITKILLLTMLLSGIIVATWSYIPLLLETTIFHVKVINFSIAYFTNRSPFLDNLFLFLYLFAIVPPFLIVSDIKMKLFGALMLVSVCTTYVFYRYAFCSVWCFFGAILSLYIAYMMYHLPHLAPKKE